MSRIKLLVLFGGASSEHEVSCVSAASVVDALDEERYDVLKIGITKKGHWLYHPGGTEAMRDGSWAKSPDAVPAFITPDRAIGGIVKYDGRNHSFQKIDCVFPVLHGKNGEDGTVQGLLRLSGIPFVGCDVTSSAVCMDKVLTNAMFLHNGLPHCRYETLTIQDIEGLDERADEIVARLGLPLFVKPANAGSSIGITRVTSANQLQSAVMLAAAHDTKILIEENVTGKEIECAVLGGETPFVSIPGEIDPQADFYDYEAKYNSGQGGLYVPARIDDRLSQKVREMAAKAFTALGCEVFARIDFFVDGDKIMINEINTIPGFTDISMFPRLMEASGIPYSELLDRMVGLAMQGK